MKDYTQEEREALAWRWESLSEFPQTLACAFIIGYMKHIDCSDFWCALDAWFEDQKHIGEKISQ